MLTLKDSDAVRRGKARMPFRSVLAAAVGGATLRRRDRVNIAMGLARGEQCISLNLKSIRIASALSTLGKHASFVWQ
jgi:hypothetical protein